MPAFYLASQSARRRDLLRQVGARFEPLLLRGALPRGADVDESVLPGEEPAVYVRRVAREKAMRGRDAVQARALFDRPVLGADTTVIHQGCILGKPTDAAEAAEFLQRLANSTHEVHTAVCISCGDPRSPRLLETVSVTRVTLRAVSAAEVERYSISAEGLDKAGGYAIQGLAAVFVTRIEGSYSGVVGLPLAETAELLAQAGVHIL
jgi:septum formation protein